LAVSVNSTAPIFAHAGLALDAVASMYRDHSALRGYTEREFYDVGFVRARRKHRAFDCHGCTANLAAVDSLR
jgi:hypothetical protein